jgi:glyoxylase-like metal-dependent hydrolase (beta-lactamase superfamily II)
VDRPYRVGGDVAVLPTQLDVPGVGTIIVNSYVLLSEQPVLIDSGLGVDGEEYIEALTSVIDPAELMWIWLTHDDSDHTGNLRAVMELSPRARLATHALGALRVSTSWPLPLDRVHALALGDRLDVGDRTLVAVRPPTFDNPMSTGVFDPSTASLFSVDAFGAILPGTADDAGDFLEDDLARGMVAWTTFDSPWTHLADRELFGRTLEDVRRLAPSRILSSHLPAATGRVEQFLDVVGSVPEAEPFVAPDAGAFDEIVALLGAEG